MNLAYGHVGLTVDDIPDVCWELPGFEDDYYARSGALEVEVNESTAQAISAGVCDQDDYYECWAGIYFPRYDSMMQQMFTEYGCTDSGPGLPQYGDACASYNSVVAAQIALRHWVPNLDVDGSWGKNSQAALDQSGAGFQQLVPGCEPPVPYYAGAGGGVQPPGPGPGPGGGAGGGGGGLTNVNANEAKGSSSNLWMLGLGFVAVLGIGTAVALTKQRNAA